MACFHPYKGFILGTTENGKKDLYITSYNVDHIERHGDKLIPVNTSFVSAYSERNYHDSVLVPCGRCDGCLLDRSRDWATRLMLEGMYHERMYFITLTYNDKFLPVVYHANGITGEVDGKIPTLCKSDIQYFNKRLRRAFNNEHIRFYLIGEYGPSTERPHYHGIYFGLPELKLIPSGKNALGQKYYTSPEIQKCWSATDHQDLKDQERGVYRLNGEASSGQDPDDFGFISVEPATYDTCAYTARYCSKKLLGDSAVYYEYKNIVPPFSLMSRKPGIARQYYEDHKEQIYEHDEIILTLRDAGKKLKPPKYYNALYDIDEHDIMEEIKQRHKMSAEEKINAELMLHDCTFLDLMALKEMELKRRTKCLQRKDI